MENSKNEKHLATVLTQGHLTGKITPNILVYSTASNILNFIKTDGQFSLKPIYMLDEGGLGLEISKENIHTTIELNNEGLSSIYVTKKDNPILMDDIEIAEILPTFKKINYE